MVGRLDCFNVSFLGMLMMLMGLEDALYDFLFWDGIHLFQGRLYVIVSFRGRAIFGAEVGVEGARLKKKKQVPSLPARKFKTYDVYFRNQ